MAKRKNKWVNNRKRLEWEFHVLTHRREYGDSFWEVMGAVQSMTTRGSRKKRYWAVTTYHTNQQLPIERELFDSFAEAKAVVEAMLALEGDLA
jgi:hypothetical protein